MYRTIDLFAGAGGLSSGFQQTGAFQIVLAAENNPAAKETYELNHPGTEVVEDVREINYADILKKYGDIDIVIGGPPCQGFSNANRQKTLLCANNGLVKEYVRAIVELKPKVFLMENVSALKSEVHRFYVGDNEAEDVKALGLQCREDRIELVGNFPELYELRIPISEAITHHADFLFEERFAHAIHILAKSKDNEKLIAGLKKHKSVLRKHIKEEKAIKPEGELGAKFAELYEWLGSWDDSFDDFDSMRKSIVLCDRLQQIFQNIDKLKENHVHIEDYIWQRGLCVKVQSYSVLDYIRCTFQKEALPYKLTYGVLNAVQYGAPQKRERFIMLGSRIGEAPVLPEPIIVDEHKYRTVWDAISDLESIEPTVEYEKAGIVLDPTLPINGDLQRLLRDSSVLYNHFRTRTGKTAQARFDQLQAGQNFHDLPNELKSTYSNADRTQSTIYLKLKRDEPSGTVLNVRKSMWIHPTLNRAVSAREAARLQTFPDSFEFRGSKNAQYQQIGNAVPPILACAVASALANYLDKHYGKESILDKILYIIAVYPNIKQIEIAKKLGVSQSYISFLIGSLKKDNRVIESMDANGKRILKVHRV